MINVIKKINTVKKTRSMLDGKESTAFINNLSVANGEISTGYTVKVSEKMLAPIEILSGLSALNRHFIYCYNKAIYECIDDDCTIVGMSETYPSITTFTDKGEEKILIAGGTTAGYVLSSNGMTVVDLCEVEKMAFHAGRLFTSLKNTITFSKLYEFTDTEISFPPDGTIFIPEQFGKIEYMCSLDGNLCVFTSSTIFLVSCDGDSIDFKLKRLKDVCLSIDKDTAIKVCDSVFFFQKGKFYKYSNGNINPVSTVFDSGEYKIIGKCVSGKGEYYIPVTFKGKKGIYIFDSISNRDSILEYANPIISDDGYIFDESVGFVSAISKSDSETGAEKTWRSIKTDFGSIKNKVVNKIFVKSKTDCSLTVIGDFGSIDFKVLSGNNEFTVSLPSKKYEFILNFDSAEFKVENLTVEYREREK